MGDRRGAERFGAHRHPLNEGGPLENDGPESGSRTQWLRPLREAVMDATGHTKLETVLKHYGRMKRQDSLRILREAREARVVGVRIGR